MYTSSGVHLKWRWSVFLLVSDLTSPWSGILVYTYDIWSVVGVYTPVGVVTEWLWSVHSKLECTLRQGKGTNFPYAGMATTTSDYKPPLLYRKKKKADVASICKI